MKVKDYEEMWRSEKENIFVFYSQFDMGMKYKVYRKVSYGGLIRAEHIASFGTHGEAVKYAMKIFDKIVDR